MLISVATANFYFMPFDETLDIIAEAGFQNIELDLFWEWKQLNMAQHLKDLPISQAIRAIHQSGLTVTSIHDGGGVLPDSQAVSAYINPLLTETMQQLGYSPLYLVFHPPHVDGSPDTDWFERISDDISRMLDLYRNTCNYITLENLPLLNGFCVPLITPAALWAYATQNGLGITVDTTHYAQINVDLLQAARILQGSVRSVHLSDYQAGRTHVFIGEGDLDLNGFLKLVDPSVLEAVTLECSVSLPDKSDRQMSHAEMVDRMKLAKATVENMVEV
jgi:sugar phosphate isomerase/epimerase